MDLDDNTPMGVRCENCGWEGYDYELIRNNEFDTDSYLCCPTCLSDRIE